jgi:hypothetical protein
MVGGEYTLLVTVIDPFSLNAGPMTQKITLKAFTVKELKHQLQTKLLLSDGTKMMTSSYIFEGFKTLYFDDQFKDYIPLTNLKDLPRNAVIRVFLTEPLEPKAIWSGEAREDEDESQDLDLKVLQLSRKSQPDNGILSCTKRDLGCQ